MLNKTKELFDIYTRNKEDLYIRILLWAYEHQETGFTIEEIRPTFFLSAEQDAWVRKIFLASSDGDRKFFEHIRDDDTTTPSRHLYSLNEKGVTAALNYKNLQHAERSSKWALLIAVITLVITVYATILTRNSIQLATQPRVDFYLQADATDPNEYVFGIENNGIQSIYNLNFDYSVVKIYEGGCDTSSVNMTCGGSSVSWLDDIYPPNIAATPLKPGQSRTFRLSIDNPHDSDFINALKIRVTYDRQIDKQQTNEEVDYFITDYRVYTLNEARDIPAMEPYISSFRQFSADNTLGRTGLKIYWK
jgi:hypothetical protein